VAGTGSPSAIALAGDGFATYALIGGTIVFALLLAWLYRRASAAGAEPIA
jgi:hypothetical protein